MFTIFLQQYKNRRQIYQTTTQHNIMSQCIFPLNGLFQHSHMKFVAFTDYPLGSFMLWQNNLFASIFCLINKPSIHNRIQKKRDYKQRQKEAFSFFLLYLNINSTADATNEGRKKGLSQYLSCCDRKKNIHYFLTVVHQVMLYPIYLFISIIVCYYSTCLKMSSKYILKHNQTFLLQSFPHTST